MFGLLTITLIFIFSNNIGFVEIKYLYLIIGFIYLVAALFEAYSISKVNPSIPKIPYFTDGFFTKYFIKIVVFTGCGLIFYFSEKLIKYFSFICFLIAFTDFFVLLYRYAKSLTYIAFDKDTLIICTNNLQVLSANSIQKIEQRHGLTYFINKNNKSLTIRTDLLKNDKLFQEYLNEWVQKNGIANKVVSS